MCCIWSLSLIKMFSSGKRDQPDSWTRYPPHFCLQAFNRPLAMWLIFCWATLLRETFISDINHWNHVFSPPHTQCPRNQQWGWNPRFFLVVKIGILPCHCKFFGFISRCNIIHIIFWDPELETHLHTTFCFPKLSQMTLEWMDRNDSANTEIISPGQSAPNFLDPKTLVFP